MSELKQTVEELYVFLKQWNLWSYDKYTWITLRKYSGRERYIIELPFEWELYNFFLGCEYERFKVDLSKLPSTALGRIRSNKPIFQEWVWHEFGIYDMEYEDFVEYVYKYHEDLVEVPVYDAMEFDNFEDYKCLYEKGFTFDTIASRWLEIRYEWLDRFIVMDEPLFESVELERYLRKEIESICNKYQDTVVNVNPSANDVTPLAYSSEIIMTDELILMPDEKYGNQQIFLEMLRSGAEDFENFSGIAYSDESIEALDDYFKNFIVRYAVFCKNIPDKCIGYCGLTWQGEYKVEVYIAKEYRRLGYGSQVLKVLCDSAFSGKFTESWDKTEGIYAKVLSSNIVAINMLRSIGFTRDERCERMVHGYISSGGEYIANEVIPFVFYK